MSDLDMSQMFQPSEEIEGYKIYMYKAFAQDIIRFMSKRIIASIKYEIHPETDSIDISIRHDMKKDGFVVKGSSAFDCHITEVLACIKDDDAWRLAMDIVADYKDGIWHCFFKDNRKKMKADDGKILEELNSQTKEGEE